MGACSISGKGFRVKEVFFYFYIDYYSHDGQNTPDGKEYITRRGFLEKIEDKKRQRIRFGIISFEPTLEEKD